MKQFAIIGLSQFGRSMLDELMEIQCELIIIDKDRDVIELYKDRVTSAYVADAINDEIIQKLIPPTLDAAIVDLGDRLEVSILVTSYLKKIGVKEIIAKAETEEHEEILKLVGATRTVFPNQEAAKRISPLLISSLLFSYLPIAGDFVLAEIRAPDSFVGKSLIELDLRKKHQLNVVAFKMKEGGEYAFFSPEYRLKAEDVLLVVGKESDITTFTAKAPPVVLKGVAGLVQRFFSHRG